MKIKEKLDKFNEKLVKNSINIVMIIIAILLIRNLCSKFYFYRKICKHILV